MKLKRKNIFAKLKRLIVETVAACEMHRIGRQVERVKMSLAKPGWLSQKVAGIFSWVYAVVAKLVRLAGDWANPGTQVMGDLLSAQTEPDDGPIG